MFLLPSCPSLFPTRRSSDLVRVYTVSDYRIVNGHVVIDVDIVVHEHGLAAAWAKNCLPGDRVRIMERSEEHTSELQSRGQLVCRLLLEKKKKKIMTLR